VQVTVAVAVQRKSKQPLAVFTKRRQISTRRHSKVVGGRLPLDQR